MADDRWRPQPHAMVRIEFDEAKLSPPGTWQILSHGPDSPTSWWLMPISGEAIRWVAANPTQVISRCVQIEGRRLTSTRIRAQAQGAPSHG
jgi:hypothetical protein